MKRVALTIAALALVAVATWTLADGGQRTPAPATTSPTSTVTAEPDRTSTSPARLDQAAVQRQRDLGPQAQRRASRRARRMKLLAVARARPWITDGVALVAGAFDARTRTQPILVTPAAGSPASVLVIGRAVRSACTQLHDPCRSGDYRFLLATPAGTVALPVPQAGGRSRMGGVR